MSALLLSAISNSVCFQWGTYSNNTSTNKTTHNLPISFQNVNASVQVANCSTADGNANYTISAKTLSTITIYAGGSEEKKYPFMILDLGY